MYPPWLLHFGPVPLRVGLQGINFKMWHAVGILFSIKTRQKKNQKLFTLIKLFLVFYYENIFEYFADKRFQEVKSGKLLDCGFDCIKAINAFISKLVERLSISIFSSKKTQNSHFSNPFCCDMPFRFPLNFSVILLLLFSVLCLTRVNWS